MTRRPSTLLAIALLTLTTGTAFGRPYKGGAAPAGNYKNPANALRSLAAYKGTVAQAQTVETTSGGDHVVVWKVKGSQEIRRTTLSSAGAEVATTVVAPTTPGGRILGLTRSGKGLIVEVAGADGKTTVVREGLGGKRLKTAPYLPRTFPRQIIQDRAYEISQSRPTGDDQGNWLQAEGELTGRQAGN